MQEQSDDSSEEEAAEDTESKSMQTLFHISDGISAYKINQIIPKYINTVFL